jgi:hypothetical protein
MSYASTCILYHALKLCPPRSYALSPHQNAGFRWSIVTESGMCACLRILTSLSIIHACVYVYLEYIYVYTYIHKVHKHTCTLTHTHTHTHEYTRVQAPTLEHPVCVCTCMHAHVFTNIRCKQHMHFVYLWLGKHTCKSWVDIFDVYGIHERVLLQEVQLQVCVYVLCIHAYWYMHRHLCMLLCLSLLAYSNILS